MLIKLHGINLFFIRVQIGATALDAAIDEKHEECIQILLDAT